MVPSTIKDVIISYFVPEVFIFTWLIAMFCGISSGSSLSANVTLNRFPVYNWLNVNKQLSSGNFSKY